jgi:hypothetical protein
MNSRITSHVFICSQAGQTHQITSKARADPVEQPPTEYKSRIDT